MQALVWVITAGLLLQLAVLVWNIAYWKLRRSAEPASGVAVSVLIPARNEREHLPRLLHALRDQTSAPTEITICDDESDDGMHDWLAGNADALGVRWFRTAPKPDEWVGKNWACHQLGQRAAGEWLLFLDADVEPSDTFIEFMSGVFATTEATLVSALPHVQPSGIGDGLPIGMVPFSVFTTLPLQFAERRPNPAFGFANGQVIAFRRSDYLRLQPHEHVRGQILEDVKLARLVKSLGEQVHIADATRALRVRMYAGTGEAVKGFTKNTVEICGSVPRAVVFGLIMAALYLPPLALVAGGVAWAWLPVALSVLLYGASVALVRMPWWYGFFYPLAILLAEYVIFRSVRSHYRGEVEWRGRVYSRP